MRTKGVRTTVEVLGIPAAMTQTLDYGAFRVARGGSVWLTMVATKSGVVSLETRFGSNFVQLPRPSSKESTSAKSGGLSSYGIVTYEATSVSGGKRQNRPFLGGRQLDLNG
jgi:hypothetical protein